MRRMFVKDEWADISKVQDASSLQRKAAVWVGDKFVRTFQAADDALVSMNAMGTVDELPATAHDASSQMHRQLAALTLDASKVSARERERFAMAPPRASWPVRVPYYLLCWLLDLVYEGRPIQRFWVLEEVARMPYFAYISMLHLYESLGWWRAGGALRRVHFAEEWNELKHLQIMESLGGDTAWVDRFVAQHAAIAYYWGLILFYAFSPKAAYQFSELVEGHATDTYAEFAAQNKDLLRAIPPPAVAVAYYCGGGELSIFDAMHISPEAVAAPRRPVIANLYDVFCTIAEDEIEHQKTMTACQDPTKVAADIANAAAARRM